MTNVVDKVEAEVRAAVAKVKGVFESEKTKVADEVRTALHDAELKAKVDVKAATPEVQAAVTAAVEAVVDAAVKALEAHGL
jgi:hypothetical protein